MFPHTLELGDRYGPPASPLPLQLLKWIGNKQRLVRRLAAHFPARFNAYFEPFLGSGAMLAALSARPAFGSNLLAPLIDVFRTVQSAPSVVKGWYEDRWVRIELLGKKQAYQAVRDSYNANPNAADLVFISRVGYGGLIRFRTDGYISTACGAHVPILPWDFARRVNLWSDRLQGVSFECLDYREAMSRASAGDLVYCDPPYSDSQRIVYGAQGFDYDGLWEAADRCKACGVTVAVSIDGTKRSGDHSVPIELPDGIFSRVVPIDGGRSMMRRFQMAGQSLEGEHVTERLLIT